MTDEQKRALGIGGIGLVGLVLYRRMHSKTTAATSFSPSGASGSIAPYTPQAPLPLTAGESVYDPNSQNLLTTPSPIDTVSGPGNGSQAIAPAAPSYSVNVNYPAAVASAKNATKPTKRPVKAGPHGAIVAPSGHNKPPDKPGFTTIGTGHGGWIYKPKKKAA